MTAWLWERPHFQCSLGPESKHMFTTPREKSTIMMIFKLAFVPSHLEQSTMVSGMHNQEDPQCFASPCLASLSSDNVSLCDKEVAQTLPVD